MIDKQIKWKAVDEAFKNDEFNFNSSEQDVNVEAGNSLDQHNFISADIKFEFEVDAEKFVFKFPLYDRFYQMFTTDDLNVGIVLEAEEIIINKINEINLKCIMDQIKELNSKSSQIKSLPISVLICYLMICISNIS